MNRTWIIRGLLALLASTLTAVGCAAIVGADFDVHPRGAGGGSAGGGTTGGSGGSGATAGSGGSGGVQCTDANAATACDDGNFCTDDWCNHSGECVQDESHAGEECAANATCQSGRCKCNFGLWRELEPDFLAGDRFGAAVHIDGSIIVGAPEGNHAYLYVPGLGDWEDDERSIVGLTNEFGAAVRVGPDYAVVGVPGAGSSATGVVQLFPGDEYLVPHVAPVDGLDSNARFGHSVDIAGSTIAVGAPAAGAAWTFEWGGTFENLTSVPGAGTISGFGSAIATDGNTLVVGANDERAAYVYTRDTPTHTWGPPTTLAAPDGAPGFGTSLAFLDEELVVGATSYDGGDGQPGAVYFFRDGWSDPPTTITSPSGERDNSFGFSVDFDELYIIVGAPAEDEDEGAVYIFARSNPSAGPVNKLLPPSEGGGQQFGYAVSVSDDDYLVVGAPGGADGGKAYVYERCWHPEER